MEDDSLTLTLTLEKVKTTQDRKVWEQLKVYLLTYIAYSLIHFEREFWSLSKKQLKNEKHIFTTEQLSRFDFAELILYSVFLFVCGVVGDSFDQRKILTLALLSLGVAFALLGLPGTLGWYNQPYFIVIMAIIGTLNALLWPCFIAILGCWFPKKSRGFLAGLWATCNNFGNILGIQIGTQLLKVYEDWQWLMYTIGSIVFLWGIVLWFFLIPDPEAIGIVIQEYTEEEALIKVAANPEFYKSLHYHQEEGGIETEREKIKLSPQFQKSIAPQEMHGQISFWKAWTVPRVALYAISFFCTKLCVYCLLLWIPTVLGSKDYPFQFGSQEIANIQTAVDLGAIFGSMVLGYASDLMHGVRSPVALLAVVAATGISWTITILIQDMSYAVLLLMLFGQGFFINSLNNIISSVCAADLGKQSALQGNEKAISTITGIIDGTGSAGSAIGQLIVGATLTAWSWRYGYLAVISVDISICIIPVVIILIKEISEYRRLKSAAKILAHSGSKSIIVQTAQNPENYDREELMKRKQSLFN